MTPGNPNAAEAARFGTAAIYVSADKFVANVRPIIESLEAAGITAMTGIADALNILHRPAAAEGWCSWHDLAFGGAAFALTHRRVGFGFFKAGITAF
jgi:hypothetical protein